MKRAFELIGSAFVRAAVADKWRLRRAANVPAAVPRGGAQALRYILSPTDATPR
jgi:hypothetical protein